MGARDHGKNFFEAHWDWAVALGGLLVAAASYGLNYLVSDDQAAAAPLGAGICEDVAEVDLSADAKALTAFGEPSALAGIGTNGCFLISHARTLCRPADGSKGCGRALPLGVETCACGAAQNAERQKVVIDKDEDGLTDEYELANGLDPNKDDADEDLDGDGFTNFEEFEAKTKPNDALSHPDYFETECVTVSEECKPTTISLSFAKCGYKVGNKGNKFEFKDPKYAREMCHGQLYAFIGEEIRNDIADPKKKVMTGYVLESYEEKFVERKLAGGMKSKDDVSEVTVKRVSDGKKIKRRLGQKETVTDISATVSLVRGATLNKSFTKAKGEKISVPELGVSWVVENIEQKVEKGKKQVVVRIKDEATGKSTSVFSATK